MPSIQSSHIWAHNRSYTTAPSDHDMANHTSHSDLEPGMHKCLCPTSGAPTSACPCDCRICRNLRTPIDNPDNNRAPEMPARPLRTVVRNPSTITIWSYRGPPPSYKTDLSTESLPAYTRELPRTMDDAATESTEHANQRKFRAGRNRCLAFTAMCFILIAVPVVVVSTLRPR